MMHGGASAHADLDLYMASWLVRLSLTYHASREMTFHAAQPKFQFQFLSNTHLPCAEVDSVLIEAISRRRAVAAAAIVQQAEVAQVDAVPVVSMEKLLVHDRSS